MEKSNLKRKFVLKNLSNTVSIKFYIHQTKVMRRKIIFLFYYFYSQKKSKISAVLDLTLNDGENNVRSEENVEEQEFDNIRIPDFSFSDVNNENVGYIKHLHNFFFFD